MKGLPWIVLAKTEKGWLVSMHYKRQNDAEELRLALLRKHKYEDVIVAYNSAALIS